MSIYLREKKSTVAMCSIETLYNGSNGVKTFLARSIRTLELYTYYLESIIHAISLFSLP